ncbi:hypothetical protein HDE_08280 [Halotydeus destructor]|nr:hypothetical protein HDE_08280 [Halotydeus destructor]
MAATKDVNGKFVREGKPVDLIWDHIRTKGSTENGVHDNDVDNMPDWFSKQRFTAAQEHLQNHRTSLDFAHVSGLLLSVQLPPALPPLLFTKKSSSVCSLFSRYIDTMMHVARWYEQDLFDPTTDGHKSIRQVAAMHRHVAKAMNLLPGNRVETSYGDESSEGNVWISQRDMTIAQWAFIGLILQFPEKCGLHNGTQQTFAAIIYVWRVISYLLGVKDEYSMCLDSVDDTIALSRLVYEDIYRPILSAKIARAPQGHQMALGIAKALSSILGNVNGQILLNYWCDSMGIDKMVRLDSFWDILSYRCVQLLMNVVSYYANPIYRWHGNTRRSLMFKSYANRNQIVNNMSKEDVTEKFYFDLR